MKRLFLISASVILSSAAFAQSDMNSDNSLFKFDNAGNAKEVRKLGTAPEFPMLQNKTTARQVYMTIKKNEDKNTMAMNKLNDLLMQAGFANGAKDVKEADVTEAWIKPGTEGNMGSRGYTYGYYKVAGNQSEFKAWKFTSATGSVYLFAKCGNAFYPKDADRTACVTAPINLTGDKQISVTSSGAKATTTEETYVYYSRRHGRRHEMANANTAISDKYPSSPLLLSSKKDVQIMPETYNLSLSSPDNTVSVCPDSTLNLAANINVEKAASYTGNYPDKTDKQYRKISKRDYKMVARKMRKIKRKEERVARKTRTRVDVTENA